MIAKDLREGRDRVGGFHSWSGDWTAFRVLSTGGDCARISSKNELSAPHSVVNLSMILFNGSLAIFGGLLFRMRSTESGADPDLSRNTNVRRSFSSVRRDQRRGEERKVERQR